jgi:uncharacterized pyridoxamine 5'-phosphate oxidase family protein
MNDVVKFLAENPVQYLSSIGLDGKPKVRPFQFMIEEGGRLFFCTNNTKDVFSQLKKHPYVELSVASPTAAWIRLSGRAVFSKDLELKRKIIAGNELVRSIYKNAENPTFEIFYLDEAGAVIADFSGNPPKEYTL